MGNNITQRLKYKESVVKFSYKYGVTKAAIKFNECRRTISLDDHIIIQINIQKQN